MKAIDRRCTTSSTGRSSAATRRKSAAAIRKRRSVIAGSRRSRCATARTRSWSTGLPSDPLLAALADPVARPERIEPGVDDEHGVARGEIAHCARHRLRMNTIPAARGIGLLVQHLVPALATGRNLIEEFGIALRLHPI